MADVIRSRDLLTQLRDGRAVVREDYTGVFLEDESGRLYPIRESRLHGAGTVGWVSLLRGSRCLAWTLPGGYIPSRPGESLTFMDRCGRLARDNGFCDEHGGEGETGFAPPMAVYCSSMAFLRFLSRCGQQRRASQAKVNGLCMEARRRNRRTPLVEVTWPRETWDYWARQM